MANGNVAKATAPKKGSGGIILLLVVVLLIGVGAFFLFGKKDGESNKSDSEIEAEAAYEQEKLDDAAIGFTPQMDATPPPPPPEPVEEPAPPAVEPPPENPENGYTYRPVSVCRPESKVNGDEPRDMYAEFTVYKDGDALPGTYKFRCGTWGYGRNPRESKSGYRWILCDPRFFNNGVNVDSVRNTNNGGLIAQNSPTGLVCPQRIGTEAEGRSGNFFPDSDVLRTFDVGSPHGRFWDHENPKNVPTTRDKPELMDDCVVTFHEYESNDSNFHDDEDPYIETAIQSYTDGDFGGDMNDDVGSFKAYQGCKGKKVTVYQHSGHKGKRYNTPVRIDTENLAKWYNLSSDNGSSFKIED